MGLTPPFPNSPTNGDALDGNPVRANLQAIYAAIESFDGSQVVAKSIVEGALADAVNPRLRGSETMSPFVVSPGLAWTAGAGLVGSMTSGTLYYNGYRAVVNALSNHTFTASKDTYVDIDYLGNVYFQEVNTNNTSPSLTANSIRIAIIVTGASAISSINQGSPLASAPVVSSNVLTVSDSLGNLIYPVSPSVTGQAGYRYSTSVGSTAASPGTAITGLNLPVIIPSNRKLRVRLVLHNVRNGGAGGYTSAAVWDGGAVGAGAQIAPYSSGGSSFTSAGTSYEGTLVAEGYITYPTTVTKTFVAALYVSTNTGVADSAILTADLV